jgi:V/A-type H+-transporting ATPase subunit I
MALMLAGGVIATVVNMLGALPGSLVFYLIIFIIGHVFNMGINIIGTYVHASRLQYLEYFGKFYREGGKPFRPFAIKTKYVDIIKEEN